MLSRIISLFTLGFLLCGCGTISIREHRRTVVPPENTTENAISQLHGTSVIQAGHTTFALPNGQLLRVDTTLLNLVPGTSYLLEDADRLEIRGLSPVQTQKGAGIPVVLWSKDIPAKIQVERFMDSTGDFRTATGVLDRSTSPPTLRFYDPLRTPHISRHGRKEILAANYTAALAREATHSPQEKLTIRATLRPNHAVSRSGLFLMGPYDPEKKVIIFTHGLLSAPLIWVPMINELNGTPEFRENYQIAYFRYPSGLPFITTAGLFRQDLQRFIEQYHPKDITLVGHSMGGLITRLAICDSGEHLWNAMQNSPQSQKLLKTLGEERVRSFTIFKSQAPPIRRAVFFNTPHRGSPVSNLLLSRLFSSLIQIPLSLIEATGEAVTGDFEEAGRNLKRTVSIPTSIEQLSDNSPIYELMARMPITPGLPYHSILGDRGRGTAPQGGDGIVPYSSAHLADARSEHVVASDHGSPLHPDGIEEARRIFLEHLDKKSPTGKPGEASSKVVREPID